MKNNKKFKFVIRDITFRKILYYGHDIHSIITNGTGYIQYIKIKCSDELLKKIILVNHDITSIEHIKYYKLKYIINWDLIFYGDYEIGFSILKITTKLDNNSGILYLRIYISSIIHIKKLCNKSLFSFKYINDISEGKCVNEYIIQEDEKIDDCIYYLYSSYIKNNSELIVKINYTSYVINMLNEEAVDTIKYEYLLYFIQYSPYKKLKIYTSNIIYYKKGPLIYDFKKLKNKKLKTTINELWTFDSMRKLYTSINNL